MTTGLTVDRSDSIDNSRACRLDVCEQVRPKNVSFDEQNSYLREVFRVLGMGTTMAEDDGRRSQGRQIRFRFVTHDARLESLFTSLLEPRVHFENPQV